MEYFGIYYSSFIFITVPPTHFIAFPLIKHSLARTREFDRISMGLKEKKCILALSHLIYIASNKNETRRGKTSVLEIKLRCRRVSSHDNYQRTYLYDINKRLCSQI